MCLPALLLAVLGLPLRGAAQNTLQGMPASSVQGDYAGSVQAVPLTPGVRKLTLDDAIRLGLENNLAYTLARQQQQQAAAQKLEFINVLMPNLSLHAETGIHEYDLPAEGFHPSILPDFAGFLPPGFSLSSFPTVVKADTTQAQINMSQPLFNWAGYDVWRAARASEKAAYYNAQSARGLVVLNVGTSYLQALSTSAQIDYARSLLKTDETLLNQAHEEHLAGTAANLDELRARVQYESQEQVVISDENAFEKAKIALVRQIGLDPGQQIQLTEAAPYADLAVLTMGEALQEAYSSRQDYQSMTQQIRAAELERKATVHQRLPTLSFSGNYGVTGISGGVFHDTFTAEGSLTVPLFKEAKFRGDRDVAEAQLEQLRSQMADLRNKIEQQLRDAMLDLQSDSELVRVARSNVDLATTALEQSTERFRAGVDDNLPVVQAQSTLAQAQTQYVNSVYQFNQAKLTFARSLGVVDTQYKTFLAGNISTGR
ncbi:TolC family protein [Paracidobacterium acidisoli]|uniref:TolC family protein n=1 Tax=Paracidobacterium acidisoli TaxID=2303751 RepID=UPI001314FF49|nr:TolC family protein [Paracidobacterium acidisoli]MBT9331587.1 TolC family protein [Paracidobacterium acidisoli]